MFAWAIKNEVVSIPGNPAKDIQSHPLIARERVLSEDELPQFWQGFNDIDLVRGGVLRMILLTGQRPGEVRQMHREHIDVGKHSFSDPNGRTFQAYGGWWSLPGNPEGLWPGTKNGQTHTVWLTKSALTILEEIDEEREGFVFPGTRGRPVGGLDAAMREICRMLQIVRPDKVTPHDLRRTHGTTVTGLGFGIDQMNRIQNHKEGGIGSVYDRHHYREEFRQIQEAVTGRIMALVEGRELSNVVEIAG